MSGENHGLSVYRFIGVWQQESSQRPQRRCARPMRNVTASHTFYGYYLPYFKPHRRSLGAHTVSKLLGRRETGSGTYPPVNRAAGWGISVSFGRCALSPRVSPSTLIAELCNIMASAPSAATEAELRTDLVSGPPLPLPLPPPRPFYQPIPRGPDGRQR